MPQESVADGVILSAAKDLEARRSRQILRCTQNDSVATVLYLPWIAQDRNHSLSRLKTCGLL